MANVLDVLEERGFIEQCTDEGALRELVKTPQTVYCGFDPTASSLHIGNLVPLMALKHFQLHGHNVIIVMGGATGMIGDPSGRSDERDFLDEETLQSNLVGQEAQFRHLLDFEGETPAILVNNFDWTKDVSLIGWLRGIGKQVSVNVMINRESVRRRLEDREQGISYTEFSYQLLQAFDFRHLNEVYGCRIQVGASDQWGNITAGADLIRRAGGEPAYGLTFPLLTDPTGNKFGKSVKGSVMLDPKATSIWDFCQFLVRTEDEKVIDLLKMFTLLPMEEIEALQKAHESDPGSRAAHKRLAWEVTAMVHGADQADRMAKGAEAIYAGRLGDLDADLVKQAFADGPTAEIAGSRLKNGIDLVDLATESGLVKSKGEAKRMLQQGALYVNDVRAEEGHTVTLQDILPSGVVILRKGKRDYLIVHPE
ncbi:MAG: tyrosine--tRNA ligase [bacterium]